MGTIDIFFLEYSASKSVRLTPDIVEYKVGAPSPLYNLIIGKQTLHNLGVVLDFKEKSITIDSILLPMRNIVNLQLQPSVTKALQHNTVQAQEPVSTQKATKRVIEILHAKYDKANLPEIVKDNCSHLEPSQREKLLSLLLDYKLLFDGTLGDWNQPPVSVKMKEGACCKPLINVPYICTFGAPDQGQTLDVQESQTTKSALRDDWTRNVPHHTLEVVLEVTLEHMCTGLRL